jgi:AcrR family transcriptional regulator
MRIRPGPAWGSSISATCVTEGGPYSLNCTALMRRTVTARPASLAKVRAVTAEVRAGLRSDARDNRERILAVARASFAAEGVDVPIRVIARRAGVAAATVYRHFGTKEALLSEALAQQTATCAAIVEEAAAEEDPWRGFSLLVEKIMEMHALDRSFARAFASRLPEAVHFGAERDRVLRMLLELVRRTKEAGRLRADFVLEDFSLALMANEGIRAETPEMRAAASRRFAALMLQSFRAEPSPLPLPPPVRLPLTRA